MNYLLDALEGEAKKTVKQYEVSNVTYPLVVAHLREKYGNKQALIDRKLCEQVSSIESQLQLKGGHVDNSFLQKQLLDKFSEKNQRHVLRRKKQTSPNEQCTTDVLVAIIKGYINTELRIVRQVDRKQSSNSQNSIKEGKWERTALPTRGSYSCFYCNKPGHMPKDCKDVGTREE